MPRLATAATPAIAKPAPAAAKKMPATAGNAPQESKHRRPRDAAQASRGKKGTPGFQKTNRCDSFRQYRPLADWMFRSFHLGSLRLSIAKGRECIALLSQEGSVIATRSREGWFQSRMRKRFASEPPRRYAPPLLTQEGKSLSFLFPSPVSFSVSFSVSVSVSFSLSFSVSFSLSHNYQTLIVFLPQPSSVSEDPTIRFH